MKKTLFLSAILGAALCSSAFAATLVEDTTTIDGVTYSGGVYTMTGSGDVSKRTFTVDKTSNQGTITQGTSYGSGTGWQYFCSGKIAYGNTLHLGSVNADTSTTTDFSPFNLGGLIVDAGTGTWSIGRSSGQNTEIVVQGASDANMTINGSVTLLGGSGINVKSGGTWNIANGKTLTLNAGSNKISIGDNQSVAVTGAGTLSLSSNMNLGSGSSIAFSSTSKISGNGKFDGNGTVELKGSSSSYNNKFADTWTGTVVLTGNPGDGVNIDQLGTANSLVEFKGASGGYSNQWNNGTVNHNVRFTDVDGTAWLWKAFGTDGTQAITFAGKIDGNGHIVTDNGGVRRAEGFTFSGDVSEWTGGIKQISAGSHTVTFTGGATTVKAELIKHSGGNIYLVVDNAQNTSFSAAQTISSLTVQGGGTVSFAEDVAISGAMTLKGTVNYGSGLTFGSATLAAGGTFAVKDELNESDWTWSAGDGNGVLLKSTNYLLHNTGSSSGISSLTIAGAPEISTDDNGSFWFKGWGAGAAVYQVNSSLAYSTSDAYAGLAESFVVAADQTFTTAGTTINGRGVQLGDGAVLKSTGGGNFTLAQVGALSVTGSDATAKVDISDSNIGVIAQKQAASQLTLNGNTLELINAHPNNGNTFCLLNTTIDAGTLKLTSGKLQISYEGNGGKHVRGSDTVLEMAGGNVDIAKGNDLTLEGINGASRGTIATIGDGNGTSTLILNTNQDKEYATDAVIGASIHLTKTGKGTQTLSGDSTAFNGNVSVREGGTLKLAGKLGSATSSVAQLSVGGTGGTTSSLILSEGADVYATQLRTGDNNVSAHGNVTLSGGTLHITGTENGHKTSASLLLGHWTNALSTLLINGGTLDAKGAELHLSWDGTGTLQVDSGKADVAGISMLANSNGTRGNILLGKAESGSGELVLGAMGITYAQNNTGINIKFGMGTLSAAADTVIGWNTQNAGTDSSAGKVIELIATGANGASGATVINSDGHTLGIGNNMEGVGNITKVGEGSLSISGHIETTGTVGIENGTIDFKEVTAQDNALTFAETANVSLAKRENAEKAELTGILLDAANKTISTAAEGEGSIANTTISVENSTDLSISAVSIENSDILVNSGSATLDGVTLGEGVSATVAAETTLTLQNMGDSAQITSLTLNDGAVVTFGTAKAHDNDLTTTALTVDGYATMCANLVVNEGTMTFNADSILTMGCDVTIGDGVKVYITGDIASIRNGSETVTIIDALTSLDDAHLGKADIYVNGEQQQDFFLTTVADSDFPGYYKIVVAPEPATATLSLLALAGLAARRRRH